MRSARYGTSSTSSAADPGCGLGQRSGRCAERGWPATTRRRTSNGSQSSTHPNRTCTSPALGSQAHGRRIGVKHHLARFAQDQVVEVDDLRLLDLARTAVDIAREHGTPYGEIACDSVLRRGVSRAALEAALAAMEHWPYVVRARDAVAFADPGAESVVETLGRLLVACLGVDDMETQFPVMLDDGRVLRGDIRAGLPPLRSARQDQVPAGRARRPGRAPAHRGALGREEARTTVAPADAWARHRSSTRTIGSRDDRFSLGCAASTTTPWPGSGHVCLSTWSATPESCAAGAGPDSGRCNSPVTSSCRGEIAPR